MSFCGRPDPVRKWAKSLEIPCLTVQGAPPGYMLAIAFVTRMESEDHVFDRTLTSSACSTAHFQRWSERTRNRFAQAATRLLTRSRTIVLTIDSLGGW
jgi:Tfp pilus assembly protein PilV